MRKINHINQYLLEKYPNIWNTRITWMLLLGFAIHIIFFFIRFVSHSSPETLQHTNAESDYFTSGLIFVHVIISVLMLVGWLVFMLKNNAFKSFYPSSGRKLFLEFFQYFIIAFVSTTFYFSYMTGFRLFINYKYDDEKMDKNISIINRANPFLSQELELYTLDNRKYPKEFSDFYCETNINKIDKNQKYFVYHDRVYQFYSTYKKVVTAHNRGGEFIYPAEEWENGTGLAYFEISVDSKSKTFYFKKKVEDLSPFIKSTAPSYSNFSDVLYDVNNNLSSGIRKYHYENGITDEQYKDEFQKKKIFINEKTVEILNSKNPKALEELMQNFLDISKEFGISNNLNAKDWSAMVAHPDAFEVKSFVKKYATKPGQDYDPSNAADAAEMAATAVTDDNYMNENGEIVKDTVNVRDFNPNLDQEVSPEAYFKNNMSGFYYYTSDLKIFLENVDVVKSYDFFTETVHIFIWLAFALATFIFSFRITNIRSLLFSIVSAGVIVLAVTLFCVMAAFVFDMNSKFFVFYTMLIVGVTILILPFITLKRMSKLFSSIFMIISINAFPVFIWLILGIINEYQTADCLIPTETAGTYTVCHGVFEDFGVLLSYFVLICSLVFLYVYTSFIKKWKSLPE